MFDYEHIDGFDVTGHDDTRMTLLCPEHHREKTAGRLPISLVERWNGNPFNVGAQFSKGHPLYYEPNSGIVLKLGNLHFEPKPGFSHLVGIAAFGDFALGVGVTDTGHPVIDIDIRDQKDRPLFIVKSGELRVAPVNWDVDFVGTKLVLRSAPGQKVLDIALEATDGAVSVKAADFHLHGVHMTVGTKTKTGGFELPEMDGFWAQLTMRGLGIAIGDVAPPGYWFHLPIPRPS
ncbi:hypothetical protein [Microbacterium oleivorans]|uniref:hypothetical protein n=1 Tax=Microbacterium oleivorans TaxID=273677 RepID=UPI00055EBCFC|nr:hypothetical protein [Microbacterium oleivorans]